MRKSQTKHNFSKHKRRSVCEVWEICVLCFVWFLCGLCFVFYSLCFARHTRYSHSVSLWLHPALSIMQRKKKLFFTTRFKNNSQSSNIPERAGLSLRRMDQLVGSFFNRHATTDTSRRARWLKPSKAQYPKSKQSTIFQSTNEEAFVGFGMFCVLFGFLCMSVFCVFVHHTLCDVPAMTPCKHMVSGLFHSPHRGSFHLSLAVLVHYRSPRVFSLTG